MAGIQVIYSEESAPMISIIVAVFNSKATLQQCIESIAQQSWSNKELIVIDGGSTDGTVNLLRENSKNISTWISEPDRGIFNAWNKGLDLAQGAWICFLGADDFFWNASVLEKMVEHLKTLPPGIRVAYGPIMLIGINGQSMRPFGQSWEHSKESFRQDMCIPHVGTLHRRDIFERNGKFDESFQIAGDYELLLRELISGDATFVPNIIVAGQRLGGISTRNDNNLRIKLEVWRAKRMHGLPLQWRAFLWEIGNEYLRLVLCKALGEALARKLIVQCRRFKLWLR